MVRHEADHHIVMGLDKEGFWIEQVRIVKIKLVRIIRTEFFTSGNQALLDFVMRQLHKRRWTGEAWEVIE